MVEVNGELLCQKDAFLCAALGIEVGIAFTKRLGVGYDIQLAGNLKSMVFGGEG